METWHIILISIPICILLGYIFNHITSAKNPSRKLPPGPSTLSIIGKFLRSNNSIGELEQMLQSIHAKFGPVVTLKFGSSPAIFIADHSLAHQALVEKGAIFADRPPAHDGKNQSYISTSFYGPTWRVLRRNLTTEILHSSRVRSYSHARRWVLQNLLECLKSQSKSGDPVYVMGHFLHCMFSLLALMCFGDKLKEKQIEEIKKVLRHVLFCFGRVNTLNTWPRLSKIVFRKQWEDLLQARKQLSDVLIPLIKQRKDWKERKLSDVQEEQNKDEYVLSYVDTLLDLPPAEETRNLDEEEIIDLCSEFVNAGTDSTATTLQWIMANLVKYPHTQEKLFMEIKEVVGDEKDVVTEDDLQKMPYLRAVILEGLRRHPPGLFVLPHAVSEDVVLDGYVVPKNGTVNFMIGKMARDPKVWDDPMKYIPERFLSGDNNGERVFDITGSRAIKMMPFGVGRRICPGLGLAMLHLEYFIANLIWCFEWKAVDGGEVDLSERHEFTVVMKNPLKAHVCPRVR